MSHANLSKQHPALYDQMLSLDAAAEQAFAECGLPPVVGDLVKLRVSQLNGCAYCLRMHTREALEHGESTDRLAVVAAWWESQYFTAQEQAALGLAEQVTRMDVPERDWDNGSLDERQVSAITWLAITMNAWNRVAVRSHYPVGPGRE